MQKYSTIAQCVDAIERGFIVDQKDNALPGSVMEGLRNRSYSWNPKHPDIKSHVRYEGTREIWWFD